jgi:hypothetical protein
LDIKYKLKQIEMSLEHQNENVKNLVESICDGIRKKLEKNDFSYNFCVNKDNEVFKDIQKVIGIFRNFDITINEFKDTDKQTIFCVYFNKE